jgi:FAD/FMN-containing dehydrogenase
MTRKLGLAIDNLLEADVVLADGSFVIASHDSHPDLYWAIRGGGGNFGVVTSFLFRVHKLESLIAGPMLWPLERSKEVLTWYRDFLPRQSDDIYGFFAFLTVPPAAPFPEELQGKAMCGVVWCFTGPQAQFEPTFAPIRAMFGGPSLDWVGPMPNTVLNSLFDPFYPSGQQWYWKADFFNELTDEAVARHVEFGNALPTPSSTMHLYPIDGAAGRVDKDTTPWAYRDAKWAQVMVGVSPNPADNPRMIAWTKDYWQALHPHSAGGAYVNMMMDEDAGRVEASYGKHYARLTEIKKKYDPNNLFRVNQNIKPA